MTRTLRLLLLPLAVCLLPSCHGCDDDDDKIALPAAPTGIAVNAPSSGRIDVTWTDASGNELGFRIEFSTDGITFTEIAVVPAGTTMFTDRGLTPNTPYWYQVRAYNAGGNSAYDGPVMATTSNVAWTALPAGGPPRAEHAAIFDPLGPRMVVFGGLDGTFFGTNDAWELTLGGTPAWSTLTTTGGPPDPRDNHTAVYDPVGQRMIVFGGFEWATFAFANDVWALDLTTLTWTPISPAGPPSARIGHTAIFDAANQRMIVFGGTDIAGPSSEVWELTLGGTPAWNLLTTSGTLTRDSHVAIYDGVNQRMLVFGGADAIGAPQNDVWELTLPAAGAPTWTQLSPGGTAPSIRTGSAGVMDSTDERVSLFSGDDGGLPINSESWFLNPLAAPSWTSVSPTGGPPPGRFGHSAVYDSVNHRMVIFGGDDLMGAILSDAWGLGF